MESQEEVRGENVVYESHDIAHKLIFDLPVIKTGLYLTKLFVGMNYTSLLLKAAFLDRYFLCKCFRNIARTGLIFHFHFYVVLFSHLFVVLVCRHSVYDPDAAVCQT